MKKRRYVAALCIALAALLAWGAGQAGAQKKIEKAPPPGQAKKNVPVELWRKVSQTERQAAANRAKALGFETQAAAAIPAADGSGMLVPRYFSHPNYANSPLPEYGPGIRKFVDGLPGLGTANNLGQMIPVAAPDTTTYPGSDYYEIELVEFTEKMHSDIPATRLRGYRQANMGGTAPHYLGPAIVAQKDRPVRILFRNKLPVGQAGNLFVPTDTTIMGAGRGPTMAVEEPLPQSPECGRDPKPVGCFAENRATLHLHGGISPWISDGTPHQWTTPKNEPSLHKKGVSVDYVPDMWFDAAGNTIPSCAGKTVCAVAGATNNPGDGALTFYYTNQQSARLMFYHDHAWGITRLNVYAGEAAPYVITDATEQALIGDGLIPGPADTIPLVIQDKTFVPDPAQLADTDETWNESLWGGTGSLWLPHVYSPAQNPGDSSGVNQFGRWAYGPWFWPPTNNITHGPIPNPYYDPTCDPDTTWCEPPLMPGTPYNSMGMEAFHDTPVVNGTAYPTVTLAPKTYRLRILNAANDRFFNLSLYVADSSGTEVALNAAEVAAALEDPAGVFPTPDTALSPPGPEWVQIGTEGGFLPAPVVIPPQPITWVTDPTVFNAGNVDKHSLLLGPAERADVIVDFSAFAGKTLILYNDAPAAFPARDPRYDYYTGNADLRDTGGAPPTRPGYGPNTRTVMQIKIEGTPAPAFNRTALETAFKAESLGGRGVFKNSQHPIIVGQGAYNTAYGSSFQTSGPNAGLVNIFDTQLSFKTLAAGASGPSLTIPLLPKQIQDEMGEAFDPEYGRMSGFLGLESPNPRAGGQNMILYPYVNPASELIDGAALPRADVAVAPIATAGDGTQIWKITHNGVDTHPIHFHLYDVQLINRVGWDGIIRKPHPSELGWKETVRISPLEDTIVALRPVIPVVPFELPNSIRPLNPALPLGSMMGFNNQDANGNPTAAIVNEMTNFGHEYVWHCHILSHEEMDMMRPIALALPPKAPTDLKATVTGSGNNRRVLLSWTDNAINETSFTVQRATSSGGPWSSLATLSPNAVTYTDPIGNTNQVFFYKVIANNMVGYAGTAGYLTLQKSAESQLASTAPVVTVPAAPSNLTGTTFRQGNNARVTLTWTDNANNETGFTIQRASNNAFTVGLANSTVGANVTTFTTGNLPRNTTFFFRVQATNAAGASGWSNTFQITTAP